MTNTVYSTKDSTVETRADGWYRIIQRTPGAGAAYDVVSAPYLEKAIVIADAWQEWVDGLDC